MRNLVFLLANLLLYSAAFAQQHYPRNYFRNPLDVPIQLAANFGELRPNHFHMGLDIRTQSRENLPVYAAADGYVSRVKIEKWGYGRAIYITHPNGFVTLYAHLNAFYTALDDFILAQQYADESWEQDIDLPPGKFPVMKGQFIAFSGNTGGSAGPHLHFEIRDAVTGNNLNPLLFGFGIPDNIPPVIEGLYLYDRRYSTYQVAAKRIAIKASGSAYSAAAPVVKVGTPLLSLGITAEDKSSNSPFKFGIFQAELWMDDSLLHAFRLDDISYDDTRYVNACIDYSKYYREKVYVQHLSTLPGNRLNIFSEAGGTGVIILADTLPHEIAINVKDVNGNAARLRFRVQLDPRLQQVVPYPADAVPLMPGEPGEINGSDLRLRFSNVSWYDGIPFRYSVQPNLKPFPASPAMLLQNNLVPVHDSFFVQLRTRIPKGSPLRDRLVVYLQSGKHFEAAKGIWDGDWMGTKLNRLGSVQLLLDTIPPVIVPVGWKQGATFSTQKTLRLRCTDELDEVDSFRALLDGQWIPFAKKNDDFIYSFDQTCGKGKHELEITVTDKAGNVAQQVFTFTKL